MNSKFKITILTGILAIAMISTTGYSQNHFSGPRNMGAMLNSTGQDQGGAITPSGLSFYFSRSAGPGSPNDIWVSSRATLNSPWGSPEPLGPTINSSSNEVVPSFSRDGLTMFFTSDRLGNTDIYLSTRTDANNDFGWMAPVNLGAPINTKFPERGATYFEDPATGTKTLIFAREPVIPPATPFHDLYQSTRNADGTFNAPTPIDELNSAGSETRAMFRSDGLEVFIHTARPGGLSPPPPAAPTFDIFVSTRASTTSPWSTPILAADLNTASTEGGPALSPDGSILYFQSDRPGGLGGNDLYSVTRCSSYSDSPCGVNRTVADFNGDGQTDLAVFRPSDSTWHSHLSGTNDYHVRQFGTSGDKPVEGDYDGDGRGDVAIFRATTGDWWILRSSDNAVYAVHWGLGTDRLVPGDYDGDRKTDQAVYRDGTWYILQSSNGQLNQQQFGSATDIPIAALP